MSIIIIKKEQKPAMLFEEIGCRAFNEDPEQITDAGFFDFNFVPSLTEEGLHAMCSIIDQLVKYEVNPEKREDLYSLRNSFEIGMDHEISVRLLGYLANLINN